MTLLCVKVNSQNKIIKTTTNVTYYFLFKAIFSNAILPLGFKPNTALVIEIVQKTNRPYLLADNHKKSNDETATTFQINCGRPFGKSAQKHATTPSRPSLSLPSQSRGASAAQSEFGWDGGEHGRGCARGSWTCRGKNEKG